MTEKINIELSRAEKTKLIDDILEYIMIDDVKKFDLCGIIEEPLASKSKTRGQIEKEMEEYEKTQQKQNLEQHEEKNNENEDMENRDYSQVDIIPTMQQKHEEKVDDDDDEPDEMAYDPITDKYYMNGYWNHFNG
jgi:hypothetical protein